MADPKKTDSERSHASRGRRALIKGGLVAVPAMITLRGRPLLAGTGGGTLGDYNDYTPGQHNEPERNPYEDPSLGDPNSPDTFSR